MAKPIDLHYEQILAGVGGITTNFAKMEFLMDLAIWILNEVESTQEGDKTTKSLRFSDRLELLSELCEQKLPPKGLKFFQEKLGAVPDNAD